MIEPEPDVYNVTRYAFKLPNWTRSWGTGNQPTLATSTLKDKIEDASQSDSVKTTQQAESSSKDTSSTVELPSQISEPIAMAEEGIMKTDVLRGKASDKPNGSAIVVAHLRIGNTEIQAKAGVCVDTGADATLCTLGFLTGVLGEEAKDYIRPIRNPPKLRSATGHQLTILGRVNLIITLGTYKIDTWVTVQDGNVMMFLLGMDAIYNKLTFDRGRYLVFPSEEDKPVPIYYSLDCDKLRNDHQLKNIAPMSKALFLIKVTEDKLLTGRDVLVCPLDGRLTTDEFDPDVVPIVSTVSRVQSNGEIFIMIENKTEDLLTILPGSDIAQINILMEEKEENGATSVFYVEKEKGNVPIADWPEKVLTKEFLERVPPNVRVRKERVDNSKIDGDLSGYIRFIQDKRERRELLDGTGEGFPTPACYEPHDISQDDPEGWLQNIEHNHLTEGQWLKLKEVIVKYDEAFTKSKKDVGCCTYFEAELPLKEGTGYLYNKPRPMSYNHKEIAAQTISDLLEQGIIRPSKSPHATNIVVVKKKALNGVTQHRVCVDLRQVNANSIPNRFPNYQVEEAMSKIQGSALRTALDFANAFHQILLKEESIPVTAFYCNGVLYEYVRVPFGHVCAMNIFCCVMALLCEKYEPSLFYADDLMVVTKAQQGPEETFSQHLKDVAGMLERIIKAGLKLKAHKCQWMYGADKPMDWLGFTLEANLLRPQLAKVETMLGLPAPQTEKQALSYVALFSFYRKFIENFAAIAKPIYDAIKAYRNRADKLDPFEWTNEADAAFNELKRLLSQKPVLRAPRQGEPFIIYTDASHVALGVVLCQADEKGAVHPCAYASRKFNDTELRYSTALKELLAIIYALTHFSYYITGNHVHIYSDCRAWTFLKLQTGISGKISRYSLYVQDYDITVSYIQGSKNKVADGLSRMYSTDEPCDNQVSNRHPALEGLGAPIIDENCAMKLDDYLERCGTYIADKWPKLLAQYESDQAKLTEIVSEEANYVEEILSVSSYTPEEEYQLYKWRKQVELDADEPVILPARTAADSDCWTEHEVSSDDEDEVADSCFMEAQLVQLNEGCFSEDAFQAAQEEDPELYKIISAIKSKKDVEYQNRGYFIKKKVLMRQRSTRDGQEYEVVCVPRRIVGSLLDSTHGNLLSGHHGSQRYLLDMTRKYYWKGMKDEILDFQRRCYACQLNDKYPVRYKSGQVIRPKFPMHIVHYDLVVGLPRALDGSHAIILFYDGFSRFIYGIPLASEKAEYIVKKVMGHFVAAFGFPWALHSDNGKNVDGNLMRYLAAMMGVVKTTTPPHTPNANPCETACAAISMLLRKSMTHSDQRYWPQFLPFILNALNNTVHTAHGYTPSSLFLGRVKQRPVVPLVPSEVDAANVNEYYQMLRKSQEAAYQITRERNERLVSNRKDIFDKKARKHKFEEGDFIMVKNLNPASGPGKLKLRAKYLGPFRVIKAYPSSLAVVPWSENARFEQHLRNRDMRKLITRGDVKPFHVRMVSVKHCKPYRGDVNPSVDVIDPVILHRFLDKLDVNSNDEIVSVIVDDETPHGSDITPSSASHKDGGGSPERIDLSHHPPESDDDGEPDFLDDIEADLAEADAIRKSLIPADQWSQASSRAKNLHEEMTDLLRAAKSADKQVRDAAVDRLGHLVEEVTAERREFADFGNFQEDPDTEDLMDSDADDEPAAVDVQDDPTADIRGAPEWVYDPDGTPTRVTVHRSAASTPVCKPSVKKPLKTSTPQDGATRQTPVAGQSASAGPEAPKKKGRPMGSTRRFDDWIDKTKPTIIPDDEEEEVRSTRSGRVVHKPQRYDAASVSAKQKEASIAERDRRSSARLSNRFQDVGKDIEDIEEAEIASKSPKSTRTSGRDVAGGGSLPSSSRKPAASSRQSVGTQPGTSK